MKVEDVPLKKIKVGTRHRQDDGDIEGLAANIRDMGLLEPIGVDRYYQLIFGWRRLIACGEILKWKTIPCVVLDLRSVLAGEYAENEFRKQFSRSERVALAEAIEKELLSKERRGGDQKSEKSKAAIAAFDPREKGKSADIAAKKAGFTSAETYQRAHRVVEKGAPEVVRAMDTGKVSVTAAAAIASQPKKEQAAIIALPKDEQREVVNRIRKAKAEQEANERRARDLYLFRGLANAVELIAKFSEDPAETWAGVSRVSAFSFAGNLDRAIECLTRIKRAHPNEPRRPERVG